VSAPLSGAATSSFCDSTDGVELTWPFASAEVTLSMSLVRNSSRTSPLSDVRDFPFDAVGKAIPYGMYDLVADREIDDSMTVPRSRPE
jgi:hypothetical protein